MEIIIVFIIELFITLGGFFAILDYGLGGFLFMLEVLPCLSAATIFFLVSLFIRTKKGRLINTILFLIIWLPIRIPFLLSFYDGKVAINSFEDLYIWSDITVPKLLLLAYYVVCIIEGKK